MKSPHGVCAVLREHVVLESECIDRMRLNVYVPPLQRICDVLDDRKIDRLLRKWLARREPAR